MKISGEALLLKRNVKPAHAQSLHDSSELYIEAEPLKSSWNKAMTNYRGKSDAACEADGYVNPISMPGTDLYNL
jgi:hypothetical protein